METESLVLRIMLPAYTAHWPVSCLHCAPTPMSSKRVHLGMSLDEMAAAEKRERQGTRGRDRGGRGSSGRGGGRGGGPVRRRGTHARRDSSFSRRGTADELDKWGHDGFEEHLRQPSPPRLADSDIGAKVRITNLHYDVIEDDLRELFAEHGPLEKVQIEYDEAGRSEESATIIFKSVSAAEKAVAEFDGRTIDKMAMKVEYVGTVDLNKGKKRAPQATKVDNEDVSFAVKAGAKGRGRRGDVLGGLRSDDGGWKKALNTDIDNLKVHVKF